MTGLAQNKMKAKRGMPLLVRSMEGLGIAVRAGSSAVGQTCPKMLFKLRRTLLRERQNTLAPID